jgi:DNA primase
MAGDETRDEIIARIKEQADIVQIIGEHVELKRSGSRFLGLCPFHGEKTPSFSVQAEKGFFHCFGCGESGDVISFMMKYHHLDFPTALRQLAEKYRIELPDRRRSPDEELRRERRRLLFAVNEKAAGMFQQYLREEAGAEPARDYLRRRGVSPSLQQRFGIGYAPATANEGWNFLGRSLSAAEQAAAKSVGLLVDKEQGGSYDRFRDRILFPIFDLAGRICGFGGRIVGPGQPKYLNSPESEIFSKGKLLLGLYQGKDEIRRLDQAVVVEGNFDLISLVGHGCTPVVAPLGTSLTREQLQLLRRFTEKVTLLFDGDAAGGKAAVRAAALLFAEQMQGRVAVLPTGHDPDSFIREKGLAALNQLLAEACPLPEYVFDHWVGIHGLGLDGKGKIVEELRPLVAAASSPLQRALCLSHFAGKLGLAVVELERYFRPGEVAVVASAPPPPVKEVPGMPLPLTIAQKPLVEFMVLHPGDFQRLAEAGIRACLAGSVGEILFLQLGSLLAANPGAEPEDLLSSLPEGPERSLVATLLATASSPQASSGMGGGRALADLLDFLRASQLKEKERQLLARVAQAERQGDGALLAGVLAELHQLRGGVGG